MVCTYDIIAECTARTSKIILLTIIIYDYIIQLVFPPSDLFTPIAGYLCMVNSLSLFITLSLGDWSGTLLSLATAPAISEFIKLRTTTMTYIYLAYSSFPFYIVAMNTIIRHSIGLGCMRVYVNLTNNIIGLHFCLFSCHIGTTERVR